MSNQQPHPDLIKADICRLLSACYYEPTETFLEEDVFGQLSQLLSLVSSDLSTCAKDMETVFRKNGVDALLKEYTYLFLGPFEIPAKPYGSVYLDGEKIVMGDSTVRAVELYQQGGFEVADDFTEMPDHIAVEIEFLYLLFFKIGQADGEELRQLYELKNRFLDEHLGKWITDFTGRIKTNSQSAYYKILAGLTEQFILQLMKEERAVDSQ